MIKADECELYCKEWERTRAAHDKTERCQAASWIDEAMDALENAQGHLYELQDLDAYAELEDMRLRLEQIAVKRLGL